jgi:hypothetical protein
VNPPAPRPERVSREATRGDRRNEAHTKGNSLMIILGLILLVIGFIAKIAILWSIGILLIVIGAILFALGAAGREIGGHRHWFETRVSSAAIRSPISTCMSP